MVMRYHWGLGVGHVYAHGQGIGHRITQEPTGEGGEHDPAANKCDEDVCYSPHASDVDENGEDECLDQAIGGDSHEESESESERSVDDDIEDYDTLDYES